MQDLAGPEPESSMLPVDSHRPDGADLLEMQRRLRGLGTPKLVRFACLLLGFSCQGGVILPMFQLSGRRKPAKKQESSRTRSRGFVLPAAMCRRALSSRAAAGLGVALDFPVPSARTKASLDRPKRWSRHRMADSPAAASPCGDLPAGSPERGSRRYSPIPPNRL